MSNTFSVTNNPTQSLNLPNLWDAAVEVSVQAGVLGVTFLPLFLQKIRPWCGKDDSDEQILNKVQQVLLQSATHNHSRTLVDGISTILRNTGSTIEFINQNEAKAIIAAQARRISYAARQALLCTGLFKYFKTVVMKIHELFEEKLLRYTLEKPKNTPLAHTIKKGLLGFSAGFLDGIVDFGLNTPTYAMCLLYQQSDIQRIETSLKNLNALEDFSVDTTPESIKRFAEFKRHFVEFNILFRQFQGAMPIFQKLSRLWPQHDRFSLPRTMELFKTENFRFRKVFEEKTIELLETIDMPTLKLWSCPNAEDLNSQQVPHDAYTSLTYLQGFLPPLYKTLAQNMGAIILLSGKLSDSNFQSIIIEQSFDTIIQAARVCSTSSHPEAIKKALNDLKNLLPQVLETWADLLTAHKKTSVKSIDELLLFLESNKKLILFSKEAISFFKKTTPSFIMERLSEISSIEDIDSYIAMQNALIDIFDAFEILNNALNKLGYLEFVQSTEVAIINSLQLEIKKETTTLRELNEKEKKQILALENGSKEILQAMKEGDFDQLLSIIAKTKDLLLATEKSCVRVKIKHVLLKQNVKKALEYLKARTLEILSSFSWIDYEKAITSPQSDRNKAEKIKKDLSFINTYASFDKFFFSSSSSRIVLKQMITAG